MGFETVGDEPRREGHRDSFDDLESGDDRDLMAQAARDLTGWFRAGSRA